MEDACPAAGGCGQPWNPIVALHTIADNTVDSVPHSNDDGGAHPALVLPPVERGRAWVLATPNPFGFAPGTVRQMAWPTRAPA